MREKGLRATGCNSAIRSINAYLKWAGSPLKIPQMKEPHLVLPTLLGNSSDSYLVGSQRKSPGIGSSTLISLLADTGCRIDEALSLGWKDIDFDNLLVLLHGKGRKDRLVPMSLELRKRLFLFQRKTEAKEGLVFPTQIGPSRDAGTFCEISNCCAELSDLSHLHAASMRCGTHSPSTICEKAGASSTFRRC